MYKKLICLLIVIQFTVGGFTQQPFLRIHQLFSGKEDYHVQTIFQDQLGMIWFGTDKGLFRFDGITLEAFTISDGLSEDRISAICSIPNSTIWIGHKGGDITIFDGQDFKVFQPEEDMGEVEITDIIVDKDGMIWYSTMGEGIFKYDGRHLSNLSIEDGLSDNYVYDIELDSKGTIWLATDYGISQFVKDSFLIISMKDGLLDNIVRDIHVTAEQVWIGTDESGLSSYNMKSQEIINYNNWEFGAVSGIVVSEENTLWISTDRQGIIQVQIKDDSVASYHRITENEGLTSNQIHNLMKDSEENIWIGGRQGVVQALPPVFEFIDPGTGTPFEETYSILKDRTGSLWVCSEKGLYRGIPGRSYIQNWESMSEKMNINEISFISLYEDSEHYIWAGAYGMGLFRIDPETYDYSVYNTENGLSDNNVIHITGTDNKVWISTLGGGVCSYDIQERTLKQHHHPKLSDSYIYSAHADNKEKIWIVGLLDYPYYISGDNVFPFEDTNTAFPKLYGIAEDSSGDIWFNTLNEGVIRLSGNEVKAFGQNEGVVLQEIQSIVFDKFNNLLIFANAGMQILNLESGTRFLLDENTGLGYRYPLLNSVHRDSDGNIWIGTKTGIIKYNPEFLSTAMQMPRLFISTSNLYGVPIDRNRTQYGHTRNNFTFGYTGLWYKNPELLTYRYLLSGYDLDWNYYDRNRIITYPKLPPADYTFKVEVSIDGFSWIKSEDAIYSFKISPPFWKRWWFILSVTSLVILGVLLYIRLRLSNLERTKKELEIEVKKRTEQIRNKTIALELQKEKIETQFDVATQQRDMISLQKEQIVDSIRYAEKIQSAILPPEDALSESVTDHFILFKPRDIVSGDYYWTTHQDEKLLIAVADCTGHGVPGAFLSMLGISSLNEIVNRSESIHANQILEQLRDYVIKSLHQTGREGEAQDGIEIALCVIDTEKNELEFAGANRPIYILRKRASDSSYELMHIKADKMPIGIYEQEMMPFSNKFIQLEKNDSIYLFSDGYVDQLGGPARKTFRSRYFKQLLLDIQDNPMEIQKNILVEKLKTWQGKEEQIDDILVVGIKI